MENIRRKIEEIILLENHKGFLALKRENDIKRADNKHSSLKYVEYLTKKIANFEEIRFQIINDILMNYSIEELYQIYEVIAKEPKDEHKMERLLTIFDLIEQKERSIERGKV